MKEIVIYDADLRWGRLAGYGLAVANLSTAILNAWAHNWFVAAAALIWVLNSAFLVVKARQDQTTRDHVRVVTAAINGFREEVERGENER